jgi:hypothetical protein
VYVAEKELHLLSEKANELGGIGPGVPILGDPCHDGKASSRWGLGSAWLASKKKLGISTANSKPLGQKIHLAPGRPAQQPGKPLALH